MDFTKNRGVTIFKLTAGTVSICSMLIIGFDRYNVIVKGFNGTKITSGKAFGMIGASWCYAVAVCTPPFLGWGNYALGKTTTLHNSVNIPKVHLCFIQCGFYSRGTTDLMQL